MNITIANNLTQISGIQQTFTSGTVQSGGTYAPVKNTAGFNSQWAVQIGQTGEETAEIMLLQSVGAPDLNFGTAPSNTAGTLSFNHAQDTPIYQIHYDQVVIYRSTAGTGGPFGSIGVTNITPDNSYTNFNDPTGISGYAYYVQYYNSLTGDLSGSSSVFIPGGPTYYSLQRIRQRIKNKLYSAGFIKDDSVIDEWINECYEQMTNSAIKANQDYLLGTNQYGFGTNGFGTITDASFKQPVKFEVTWDGVNYTRSTKMPVRSYSENDFFPMYSPRHAWIGETVFEVLPHTQAGTARITYAQRFTPLVNDSDELTQTLKGYTTAFVEYCLGVAYGLDQKDAESQQHNQTYAALKADFVAEVTPRDMTGVETIDIVESVSGMEEDLENDIGDFSLNA